MIFEFANSLAARGNEVTILHHALFGQAANSLEEISWFTFDAKVNHIFLGHEVPDPDSMPSADIFFGYLPGDGMESRHGLHVVLIQGIGILGEKAERYAFEAPCPKICVSRFLIDEGIDRFGVPPHQFAHVPYGLHHDRYPLVKPIESRPPRITFLQHTHPQKGCAVAIEALEAVREKTDIAFEVVSFGTSKPPAGYPDWIEHHLDPPHDYLINEIYNRSTIHLCASVIEGFGLTSLEAMACGAALVTTDNGGSRDYAHGGETALVTAPKDVEGLADHLLALLTNDDERIRLAKAGYEYTKRFNWADSSQMLEEFLTKYLADPVHYTTGGSELNEFNQRNRSRFL